MDMRFRIWNVKSLQGRFTGTSRKRNSKYKLDLLAVQEVRWEEGGTEPAGTYTFFYGNRNENHDLGAGNFVHKGIISAVKKEEFVNNRILY
jgi:exonuclease III